MVSSDEDKSQYQLWQENVTVMKGKLQHILLLSEDEGIELFSKCFPSRSVNQHDFLMASEDDEYLEANYNNVAEMNEVITLVHDGKNSYIYLEEEGRNKIDQCSKVFSTSGMTNSSIRERYDTSGLTTLVTN